MHLDPKCQKDFQKCTKVCINKNCKVQNPFICQSCLRNKHSHCDTISYHKMIREFHKIQGLYTQQILNFEERVENTFDELMRDLRKQFIKFREQFQYMQINGKIDNIYDKIKANKQNQLSGSVIYQALCTKKSQGIKLEVKNELDMRILKSQIIELHKNFLKNLPPYYSLKQQIQIKDPDVRTGVNHIKEIQQKFMGNRKKPSGLLQNHFKYVQEMIGKQVYNLHLLYRASEHKFSANQFHKQCDGLKNTVTIAKTQYGNIVIGYCTFPWESPDRWVYKEDHKQQCFLISPTQGLKSHKFIASKKKFAIGMHKDYGPSFGDDFVIYDKANHSKNCWSNFPDVYTCRFKKIPHNTEVIKKFVGVSDHFQKFNLIQWEVFKISFGQHDDIQSEMIKQYYKIR